MFLADAPSLLSALTPTGPTPSLVKSPDLMVAARALGILDTDNHDKNLGDLAAIHWMCGATSLPYDPAALCSCRSAGPEAPTGALFS
jgi:hypothetical protein